MSFSPLSLLHNQGSRSLLAVPSTGAEHSSDDLEVPWDTLKSHRFLPGLRFIGRS